MTLQVTLSVYELASAAGLTCNIDPALVTAISSMQTGNTKITFSVHGMLWSNGLVIRKRDCFSLNVYVKNLQITRPSMKSTNCPVCCLSTLLCPCPPWPWTTTHPTAENTEVIFIHLFSFATNCLTVIILQTALNQILITTSSSHYVLYQLLIVDKKVTPPWITGLISVSVYHTFQSDWRGLKQSMLVNEKHVSVERLLFTDNFSWRASIQLMLACGPADPNCLALSLDCNIKSSK